MSGKSADREHDKDRETVVAGGDDRVPDTKGDVGFKGGMRPDRSGAGGRRRPAKERARPRDTGRQGA
ncbi:MAG: hypothetical protein ACM30I_00580 [Gemmatimonas sp.]